jgi:hypothetical protein
VHFICLILSLSDFIGLLLSFWPYAPPFTVPPPTAVSIPCPPRRQPLGMYRRRVQQLPQSQIPQLMFQRKAGRRKVHPRPLCLGFLCFHHAGMAQNGFNLAWRKRQHHTATVRNASQEPQ